MSGLEDWIMPHLPAGGRVAVDVGANEGSYTGWLAERFEQVYALEPNPQVLPTLRRNVADRRNVRLVETAASERCGTIRLNLYPSSEHCSSYTDMGLDTGSRGGVVDTITVPAVTVDTLDLQAVDMVKVDTEGAEVAVLTGAAQTLTRCRPEVIIEVHAFENIEACQTILAQCGYTNVVHLPHPHSGVHPGHCWLIANG